MFNVIGLSINCLIIKCPINCTDINECLQTPCDQNAACANMPGSFECSCNTGYVGTGLSCSGKQKLTIIILDQLWLNYFDFVLK